MRSFVAHVESGNANKQVMGKNLPKIQEQIAKFEARDVFNADDCGFFYKMAPHIALSFQKPEGRKKIKGRFKVLVRCNSDWSVKFEFMFIGHEYRPIPFRGLVKSTGSIIISIVRLG